MKCAAIMMLAIVDGDVEQQAEEQAAVEHDEHEPREHVRRARQRAEMRDVGDDEADQRDADGNHLGVIALCRGHRDRDAEDDEQRAQDAEAQRVQSADRARAEQQIDAGHREHEDQRDQPGQSRARQVLGDVELAEVLLEQTVEAQAAKPALQLLGIRRTVVVRIEPLSVHNALAVLPDSEECA